tara:strand:- start:1115 stop:1999 length:885 start_codon:yes stop_codon:yes gene_type:complete
MGIELEQLVSEVPNNGIGDYHDGYSVEELPQSDIREYNNGYWMAERDGSINASDDESGCEFVSPIFDFNDKDGRAFFHDSLQTLFSSFGNRTNRSCGTHISISLPVTTANQYRRMQWYARTFQQAFYAMTGSTTRQSQGYAHPITEIPYCGDDALCEGDYGSEQSHSWINLTSVRKRGRRITQGTDRVEFRVFSGTTDWTRVFAWTNLTQAFIHAVNANDVNWIMPSDRPVGQGEGNYFATCLLDSLGFSSVADDSKFIDNDYQTVDEARKVLLDLANIYDAKAFRDGGTRRVL